MAFVTTKDSVSIFFKDWGPKTAQPIVFHHGWPLSADDWDNQMLFFLAEGFRVIAIDRRGHGRSDQVSDGHDMDHYAADVSAVVEHLDLYNAVHIGHSTGGGQVARVDPGGQGGAGGGQGQFCFCPGEVHVQFGGDGVGQDRGGLDGEPVGDEEDGDFFRVHASPWSLPCTGLCTPAPCRSRVRRR